MSNTKVSFKGLSHTEAVEWMSKKVIANAELKAALAMKAEMLNSLNELDEKIKLLTTEAFLETLDNN